MGLFLFFLLLWTSSSWYKTAVDKGWIPRISIARSHTILVENQSDRIILAETSDETGNLDKIGPGKFPSRGVVLPGKKLEATIGGWVRFEYESEPTSIRNRSFGVVIRVCSESQEKALQEIGIGFVPHGQWFHLSNPIIIDERCGNEYRKRSYYIRGNESSGYSIGEYSNDNQPDNPWFTFAKLIPD